VKVLGLWRTRARALLIALVILDASILVDARTAGIGSRVMGVFWSGVTSNTSFMLAACAVEAFLIWCVWRRGLVAWYLLLYLVGLNAIKTLLASASSPGFYLLGLLAMLVAQFAILISPAVRRHVAGRPRRSLRSYLRGPGSVSEHQVAGAIDSR
jgi:hypothetical protein